MYEIEKGVPIAKTRAPKYPLREMQVGDSFVVATERERKSAISLAYISKIPVRSHKQQDGTIRIWRAA